MPTFKFENGSLQRELIDELVSNHDLTRWFTGERGIYYLTEDKDIFENLLAKIRRYRFVKWQIFPCRNGAVSKYEDYMTNRKIPFEKEFNGHRVQFCISSRYRPKFWKVK